jgi:PHD/YefM family antitoxin component YafN of YafNO toxin-antitoxin module
MKQFIVNEEGERTAVVLPVEEYERLVEAFEDLEDIRIHDEAMAELDAGARPRPLEEIAQEIERDNAGEDGGA